MTLESLYFIAQIVAAAGIVASLIFVGFEVRRNNIGQLMQLGMDRGHLVERLNSWIIENEYLQDVLIKGSQSYDDLTTKEKLAFGTYYQHWYFMMTMVWEHDEAGSMPKKHTEGFYLAAASIAKRKGVREWWAATRKNAAPELREKLDVIMDAGNAAAERGESVSDA